MQSLQNATSYFFLEPERAQFGHFATLTMEETHSPYTLAFETGLLVCLRGVYFLVARHYVNASLFSDLTSVIREDGACGSGTETPEEGAIALEEAGENSYFPISPARATGVTGATGTSTAKGKGRATSQESVGESPRGIKFVGPTSIGALATPGGAGAVARKLSTQNSLYPRMSTTLFCLSFSESCMLFTLVLFGEAVQPRSVVQRIFSGMTLISVCNRQVKVAELVDLVTRFALPHCLPHSPGALSPPHPSYTPDASAKNDASHPRPLHRLSRSVLPSRIVHCLKSRRRRSALDRWALHTLVHLPSC